MRTRFLAAALAAAALLPVSVLAAVPASAATRHDVLTLGKVGGRNIGVKNILTAGLAPKTVASFADGTLTCKTSTFTIKVVKNPVAGKATAKESLIGQTFSKCSVSGSDKSFVKSVSVSLVGLPYGTTVSDSKGFPVVVSKPAAKITVVTTIIGTVTCIYSAKQIKGSASNKHQTISFKNQGLTLQKTGSDVNCKDLGTTGDVSATYGPVVDKSVKAHPKVFVN